MNITDPNSVLVIGAGTSKQYGVPDGNELFESIAKQLSDELEEDKLRMAKSNSINLIVYGAHADTFDSYPIICSLFTNARRSFSGTQREALSLAYDIVQRARDLLKRLENQTSETIDDFIYQNPDLAEVTKVTVAVMVFKSLYQYDEEDRRYNLKPLDTRYLKVGEKPDPDDKNSYLPILERNWAHLFINLVRQGVKDEKVTLANKVKVISFNYDMILEHVLDKQFMNTAASWVEDGMSWKDYIEVLHVHGKFENMKEFTPAPHETVLAWADSIAVIHEDEPPSSVTDQREGAKETMLQSSLVYGTGFSFSQSNVELIGLVDPDIRRRGIKIFYSNYDGDYGLTVAMNNYEMTGTLIHPIESTAYYHSVKVEESTGTATKFMSTVNWFKAGIPGRLPS